MNQTEKAKRRGPKAAVWHGNRHLFENPGGHGLRKASCMLAMRNVYGETPIET